jgi:glutamate/tyrosine decarboxylase-like PLP-dependent enzyme
MKAVEEYIKEHTNKYSNHVELAANITGFTPWLTVDDAKHISEIAREETINEVCEWLEEEQKDFILTDTDIERLKKHLDGKK